MLVYDLKSINVPQHTSNHLMMHIMCYGLGPPDLSESNTPMRIELFQTSRSSVFILEKLKSTSESVVSNVY